MRACIAGCWHQAWYRRKHAVQSVSRRSIRFEIPLRSPSEERCSIFFNFFVNNSVLRDESSACCCGTAMKQRSEA
jgi:hypothetical protein